MPHTVDVLLDQHGLSLSQLADRAGLSVARVDAIVNGRWTPSPDERARIAAAFGIPVAAVSWGIP